MIITRQERSGEACQYLMRKSVLRSLTIGGATVSRSDHLRLTAAQCVPPLLLLVSRCKSTSCRLAPSACSATASRLQQLRTLETTRPHDNTPTGRRSPGLFCSLRPLPSHALQGWQGGTCCGMLDGVLQYNRPRRRDEVADFVAASGGDYTFLRLCGLHCAAAYLYLAARRAHRHAPQLTQGQSWRTLERRHRAQRTQRARTSAGTEASPRADVRGAGGCL